MQSSLLLGHCPASGSGWKECGMLQRALAWESEDGCLRLALLLIFGSVPKGKSLRLQVSFSSSIK